MTRRLVTALLLTAACAALLVALLITPRAGHPVTPFMESAAEGAIGRAVDRLPGASGRPTVVVFILPGCPCSEALDPHARDLFDAYGDRVAFVGVVAGDAGAAEDWKQRHRTPYAVVADPDRGVARGYGATRSAYTALVIDGTVRRLWPGYSAGMLREVGDRLAEAIPCPTRPLTTDGAPERLTSGCLLEQ